MSATTWWAVAAACWVMWATWPRPPIRRPGGPNDDVEATDVPNLPAAPERATGSGHSGARRRSRRDRADALADWCAEVARMLRSGETLAGAIRAAPPAPVDAVAATAASLARGNVPPPTPSTDADSALVVGVLTAAHTHGGPAAEPLDRAASVLRSRAALTAEARTQSAQARWSAQVMTALPTGMLAVLVATSSDVRAAIAHPAGATAVAVGAVLNVLGWWWLRRLLARPLR